MSERYKDYRRREMLKPRDWSLSELVAATKKLKIGQKVQVRLSFGEEDDNKAKGKLMKGKVTEKYNGHFLVRVKSKSGKEWNESYTYIDLMDARIVKVL